MNSILNDKQQGLLAIFIANTIFGLNIPVTRSIVAHWMSPMGYTITRMLFGAIIFWIISSFLKYDKVQKKDLLMLMIGGLMGFLGTQLLFSQSLEYTTPVVFSLLMALTPVVVLILSAVMLKEGIPKRKILGIIISISGAALIILLSGTQGEMGSNNTLGIFYAFLCVLCYAGYLVLTRKISMKYQPVTVAKWMFLFSALASLPLSYSSLQNQRMFSDEATFQAYSLLAFSLLFSTTMAFFLMPVALKRLEASTVSIFMNLQPIVASVVAIVVGQDAFTWDKPVAALLVVIGVYLVTTQKGNQHKKEVATKKSVSQT
ncbi:DMT family transporter [Chondrinema litorale]|uniref:DMT family transporter n=1 Tax=Chondrinema litorale TaxID=2994555 RepID=UPI00254379A8|nr:DMT family transporter [Chondrinema litorale]UZR96821.1 DMT family transporter [Chondrinema litorale]